MRDSVAKVFKQPRLIARDMKRRRDANKAGPASSGNQLTRAAGLRQFGWIGPAISFMGNTARWAYSLNPDNDIIVAPGYPLEAMSTSPASLLNACAIAVAGNAVKTAASAAYAGAAATLDLSANSAVVFGALVRISNSTTNFKFGTYEIQLAANATVLSYVYVQVASLPCEVVILSINNNAGKATVIGDAIPKVIFPYSATSGAIGNLNYGAMVAGDVLYAETLNMRDIGNIVGAVAGGAILL